MKICFLADIASIHTRRWIKAAQESGFDVLVISPTPYPVSGVKVFLSERLPTRSFSRRVWRRFLKVLNSVYLLARYFGPMTSIKYIFDIYNISRGLGTNPNDITSAVRQIDNFNPDIIHIHNINIPLYQWLIIRNFKKPKIVATTWGDDVEEQTFKHSALSRMIKNKILLRADVVTSASRRLAEITKNYAPVGKVEIIPFGVDMSKYQARVVRPGKIIIIGTIRHLRKTYGIDLILKAAAELDSQNWRLIIGGDGDIKRYSKLAKELGISDKTEFLGELRHQDVPKILRKLDIFMMPSRWEAFGVAGVEAEAVGLPVVGTKVGGIPEVVKNGVSGVLVPSEDYHALAKELQLLISNPERITKLSRGAARYVRQHFDWEKNTQQMFRIYRRLEAR